MKWKAGFVPGVGQHGYYLLDRGDVYILRIKHQDKEVRRVLRRSIDWVLHLPSADPQTLPTLKRATEIAEEFIIQEKCHG